MADACPRLGKWFRGCQYGARYDEAAPLAETLKLILERNTYLYDEDLEAIRLSRPATYVCDVCLRCGKTVERA